MNPPALPGTCQADKMKIWLYTGGTAENQNVGQMTLQSTTELDVVNTRQPAAGVTDRWAMQSLTYKYDYNRLGHRSYNHFALPALAYLQADADRFTLNGVTDGSYYTTATLTVDVLPTPELFFGRLRLKNTNDVTGTYDDWNDNGHFRYTYSANSAEEFTFPITGHLYRIVGQLNVNITEVPTDMVEKMELLMTNVPKKIGLYGTHGNVYGQNEIGRFYPITAAKSEADCFTDTLQMAEVTDFPGGKAQMSFFLLPSEVGGELKLRVYFKGSVGKDDDGNDIKDKTYPVTPGMSAFLTGDDADVYNVQDALKDGSNLYVYNASLGRFYSYANVRVNVTGKYDDMTAEQSEVTVAIEVEPGYEREHTITIF